MSQAHSTLKGICDAVGLKAQKENSPFKKGGSEKDEGVLNIMEKIICFSLGLSEEDIEKGKSSFYGVNKEAPPLALVAVTKAMLNSKVGDILESIIADSGLNISEMRQGSDITLSPGLYKYRVVILLTSEHQQVLQVMRSFKAVLPNPQNIIFAVITETALNWTFGEYIVHLGMEHEYMKNRNPKDDPDMKRM